MCKVSVSFISAILLGFTWNSISFAAPAINQLPRSPHNSPQKLVIAMDGFSIEAFHKIRSEGYFASFNQWGAHIAPYPSLTDPSWTEITGAREVFGSRADLQTIEAKFFDFQDEAIVDDSRNVFTRMANPFSFMRAFNYYFNPFIEPLMYFKGDAIVDAEITELENAILTQFTGDHYIAYAGSVDAIAHTQKDKLLPFLRKTSGMVERLEAKFKAQGRNVEIWIISDHGNVGIFNEGEEEIPLRVVTFDEAAKRVGMEVVGTTEKLTRPNQIALPVLALCASGGFYFKDLRRRGDFARELVKMPEIDLVTWLEVEGKHKWIEILNATQSARLYWMGSKVAYQPLAGDPLSLPEVVHSRDSLKWFTDEEFFRATAAGPYPDAPFRLVQGARKQVANEPDLLVSLKDGYRMEGPMSEFVTMYRTHGSLNARNSNGLFTTNRAAPLPPYTRGKDILKSIGLTPRQIFGSVADLFPDPPSITVLKSERLGPEGIPTRVSDYSTDIVFRRLVKILNSTVDVVSSKDIRDLQRWMGLFFSEKAKSSGEAKTDPHDILKLLKGLNFRQVLDQIDELAGLKDILAKEKDPEQIRKIIQDKILNLRGLEPLKELLQKQTQDAVKPEVVIEGLDAFRRAVMKIYTLPFLVNEWLNLPEGDFQKDTRDFTAIKNWFSGQRERVRVEPKSLDEGLAQGLFQEIMKERELYHRLLPATFPVVFNSLPKEVTVVFVPGIYNELFDTEIFSRGLRSLTENLGIRTLYADVDGRCGSALNGKLILDRLKADTESRLARGYPKPKYLIFGYSKGGVDSLDAFLLDREFVRSQVLGLVAIASPLQGTSIIESVDLPSQLTQGAVLRQFPQECKTVSASQSITRAGRSNFWAKNIASLAGLTRYYSISFKSDMENAHPWMKISKLLAKFNTDNDGVVTVAASKFPAAMSAIDLGTVQGDHLSGILASKFPQEAFLEALVLSLQELGGFEKATLQKWYQEVTSLSAPLVAQHHRREMVQILLRAQTKSKVDLFHLMGPLPFDALMEGEQSFGDTEAPESDRVSEWYKKFAEVDAILEFPVNCLDAKAAQKFSKALQKVSRKGHYALRSFGLECTQSGLVLHLETKPLSIWTFWKSAEVKSYPVATVREIVERLLSLGLESGENLLAPSASDYLASLPVSQRKPLDIPPSTQRWSEDLVIDLRTFPEMMALQSVTPFIPELNPQGIAIIFDHRSMKDFRAEYRLSYESKSPGGVDNDPQGYFPWLDGQELALRMRSKSNSIRLTTSAIRFKPSDFPKMNLRLKVNQGVTGADPQKGGSGKDDSAFQLWFTLRKLKGGEDRSRSTPQDDVRLFGYYWADPNERGQMPAAGAIIENYYSKKNFLIATLPESYQLVLDGGKASEGRWFDFQRNFAEDLKQAFPNDLSQAGGQAWEVVAMTFQTDSDDSKSESECLFKKVVFEP